MMTEDDDGLVRVKFSMGAGGNFSHGHQERPGKAGGLDLPRFAHVQKNGSLVCLAQLKVSLRGDLRIKHA